MTLQAGESVEYSLVVDTTAASVSSATEGNYFGSLLTITDAAALIEYELPVSFTKGSVVGLWLGEISVTHIPYTPKAQSIVGSAGQVTGVNIVGRQPEGYAVAPVVSVSPPSVQGVQAVITANISGGTISSFTVTNPGSGYEKAPGIRIAAPPASSSTPLPKPMPLRLLMHLDNAGTNKLLSNVFLGTLDVSGELGLTTSEALLDSDTLEGASRFSVAHLPLDVVTAGTWLAGGILRHQVDIPYNDPTNPFVHQYHPDHDNLDARFETSLAAGDESPSIRRTLYFEFTTTEPTGGSTPLGWGSSILGGNFTETLEGIHSDPITLKGHFQIQRVSSIPTLTQ